MTRKTTKTNGLSRRSFIGSGATLGAMAGLGGLPFASSAIADSMVEGSILTARVYADISSLDPAFWTSAVDAMVIRCLFAHSLMYDTNSDVFEAQPSAMKSYEFIDDTHIAFELHEGIMYSGDYGEMTAEDAKYSFERIANPELNSPYMEDWATLDHVEVTGKYTGVIVLTQPFAPLLTTTLPGVSGVILPKAAIEDAGGRFSVQPPCFSGPYRIKDWQPKTRLILERNPDWTLTDAPYEELHLIPIEDPKTAELGFEAGDLDFSEISVSSIPRYEANLPAGAEFNKFEGLNYYWMGINELNDQLADKNVRRAIQLAVDRKTVVDASSLGGAVPAAGIIAPALIGSREANLYDRDVEESKRLLEEAGMANSLNLTISIQQTAENLAAAQVIQANLAEVGIQVTINQYESGTFWSLGSKDEGDQYLDLQLFLMRFSMQPDPSWATMWFTPQQIGIWNWQGFDNAEFGELQEAAQIEIDTEKRDGMYKRMQDLMEESGDFVFLNFVPVGVLNSDKVQTALRPDGEPVFYEFSPKQG
ncbi:ABC transporter substrate-binding protein [Aliiroseovarius sediminis]|uniref:ABC transporter substrate-binding protein n=1 Tax=Aliiroseovarius sediminis TaxID=2925839 RepID=UPI001F565FEE|nr:ABC transporter substrate-binding protein [Aliiroseovarius sediminis]MCI2393797.1 ABC transporter substrate-binding protein [Aliiroseovarius sediminis]